VRGDERTLEDAERVAAQDLAIFEGARFTLGGVHDHRGREHRCAIGRHSSPLASGREPGAPATAQARSIDEVDDRRRIDRTSSPQGFAGAAVAGILQRVE
jgi:hypothetical protein